MIPRVSTFVLRLKAHRPAFAQTITEEELQVMGRHAAHWQAWIDRGDLVAFGPVLTDDDSYGLAVVETDDEPALREHAAADPAATSGIADFEIGRMPDGRASHPAALTPPAPAAPSPPDWTDVVLQRPGSRADHRRRGKVAFASEPSS